LAQNKREKHKAEKKIDRVRNPLMKAVKGVAAFWEREIEIQFLVLAFVMS